MFSLAVTRSSIGGSIHRSVLPARPAPKNPPPVGRLISRHGFQRSAFLSSRIFLPKPRAEPAFSASAASSIPVLLSNPRCNLPCSHIDWEKGKSTKGNSHGAARQQTASCPHRRDMPGLQRRTGRNDRQQGAQASRDQPWVGGWVLCRCQVEADE